MLDVYCRIGERESSQIASRLMIVAVEKENAWQRLKLIIERFPWLNKSGSSDLGVQEIALFFDKLYRF